MVDDGEFVTVMDMVLLCPRRVAPLLNEVESPVEIWKVDLDFTTTPELSTVPATGGREASVDASVADLPHPAKTPTDNITHTILFFI
jgi:hypothetical protein